MGWLPGFEYDLFVSYAHIDDQPDVGQQYGWVTALKDNLKTRLDRRLGIRSNIWMDQRLVVETRLSAPIMDGLKQSAGLLVILSRAYLNSAWCGRERGGFLDGLQDRRAAQRPVFLVECDEMDRARLPDAFGDLLSVRFWQRATDGAAPQRLGDPLPTLEDRTYWARLNDLSFKISEELSRRQTLQVEAAPALKAGPAVFLAEVTDDLLDEYEKVQRSLEQARVVVLPDRAYPRDAPEAFARAMNEDLGRCKALVQLLGPYAGRVRGWNKSLAALQYETAQLAGAPIRQWRRFELGKEDVKDDAHREIVFGPHVVNDNLEVFIAGVVKAAVWEEPKPRPPTNDSLLVFVNHDRNDAKVAADLCDFFDAQGLGSLRPEPHDTAEAMRADLEDNLKLCDGLVLVYGGAQPTWVRQQRKETLKIKGARERPLARVVLCHAAPDEEKVNPGIQLPNQRIVDCRRGLDANAQQALTEFVRDLRGAPA
jgi:TIR domain